MKWNHGSWGVLMPHSPHIRAWSLVVLAGLENRGPANYCFPGAVRTFQMKTRRLSNYIASVSKIVGMNKWICAETLAFAEITDGTIQKERLTSGNRKSLQDGSTRYFYCTLDDACEQNAWPYLLRISSIKNSPTVFSEKLDSSRPAYLVAEDVFHFG